MDKQPGIVTGAMIVGTAIHKALEENFRYKIETEVDLDSKEVAKIYRSSFDERADLKVFRDLESLTEDQVDWEGVDPKDMRERGQKTLLRYHKQHAPFIRPKSVERRVDLDLGDGVTLTGIMDLETTTDTVIDFKTSNRVWDASLVETSLQPTVYAALLGRPITFDYHFITKGQNSPGISVRRTVRTNRDIDFLLKVHIPQAVRMIREEMWIRSPGMQCFSCSARLRCGYRVS